MKKIIKSNERGKTELSWLESYHTFSFGEFYNQEQMGYQSLRVMNDDTIHGGGGFGMHPHKNMEILSYVPEGRLEHKDSLGNHGQVGGGKAQLMSAGRGILHSEFNPSEKDSTHLIQIWIQPKEVNTEPAYFEKELTESTDGVQLLASPDGRGDSMPIKQDAWVYNVKPEQEEISLPSPDSIEQSVGYLFVVKGKISIAGQSYEQGDSLELEPETIISEISQNTDLLWFVFEK